MFKFNAEFTMHTFFFSCFRYNLLASKNFTQNFNSDLAEYSGHIFATCLGDPSWIKTCKRAITRYDSNSTKLTIGHPGHFRKVWDFWRNRGLQQVLSTGNASILPFLAGVFYSFLANTFKDDTCLKRGKNIFLSYFFLIVSQQRKTKTKDVLAKR